MLRGHIFSDTRDGSEKRAGCGSPVVAKHRKAVLLSLPNSLGRGLTKTPACPLKWSKRAYDRVLQKSAMAGSGPVRLRPIARDAAASALVGRRQAIVSQCKLFKTERWSLAGRRKGHSRTRGRVHSGVASSRMPRKSPGLVPLRNHAAFFRNSDRRAFTSTYDC